MRRRRGRSCRRRPSAWPGRRRTASPTAVPRPSRRGGRPTPASAWRTSRGRRGSSIQRSWSSSRTQRGDGRRVVRLVEPAVVERDAEVERRRAPAVAGGDPLDALDGGRRARREPQPAVGGEALLRGEVVDVDLGRIPRQAAGRRRGVDGDQRAVRARRAAQLHRHAGRRLVVGQRVHVDDASATGVGVVAGFAGTMTRCREVRRGRAGVGELRRELAEHEVLAALLDEPERGDVPEHRRAAVAEHDLPAVRQPEQVGQARPDGRRRAVFTGAWRCDVPSTVRLAATSASTCSGRTLTARSRTGRRPGAGRRGAATRSGGSTVTVTAWHRIVQPAERVRPVSRSRRHRPARLRTASPRSPSRPRSPSTPRPRRCRPQGEAVIGFGAGEPDFPTPDAHRRGGGRGLPRPAQPPLHAGRRAARAQGGDRRQDQARQRVRLRGRPGARDQRRQARGVHGVRRAVRSGRRGDLPGAVLDDVPGGDHARRRRAEGRRHHARRPASRSPSSSSTRRGRRAPRCCCSSARTTRRARCTRRTRWRRSAGGPSSAACGSSPTRSTSTSRTGRTSSSRCRRSCPTSPSSASSSTASPRPTP